jgi:cellulose synthase/poly-beta-1,6-N-acetylglucosamine synthase-like glycosyltransferase
LVYADSGSSDDSVAIAKAAGAEVVDLEATQPFTAARARNEGFAHARWLAPSLRFVQFVDGDCILADDWIDAAAQALEEDSGVVAVCGRRRERFPEASRFNQLCDLEWDTPVGESDACGGDVMLRADRLEAVGGYEASLIAGEDPELSHRLRSQGGKILRLDREMTLHDADMHRFSQWWVRSRRAGHAYAECWHRHWRDGFRLRELRSILAWGLALPVLAVISTLALGAMGGVWLLGYPLLFAKVYLQRRRNGSSASLARLYAGSVVVGKFAQAMGALEYGRNRFYRRRSAIIEYKG